MDAENIDPSIRVQVLPSQNAYFAGETFSVTVTFTNTRLPVNPSQISDPASAPVPVQKSHKRNAHSISSAPLARPPTSPGLGSRPPDIVKALGSGVGGGRMGLIGNGVEGKGKGKEVLESRRSALEREKEKVRSASVDITANGHSQYVQAYQLDPAPTRTSFPLPQNHPHARKHSVFDGHLQLNEVQSPAQPQPPPAIPSSSTSTFSLALDPIAETPLSPTPPTPPPASTVVSEVHSYPPRPYPTHQLTQSTLGHGHPPLPLPPKSTSSKPLPPDATLLLYSYLQLSGTAYILPQPNAPPALAHLRAQLLKPPVLGGGSMDIARSRTRPGFPHSRSTSFTGSLLSLLSPSSFSSPGRSRAPSLGSPSDVVGGAGLALNTGGERGEEEMPLPVFEVQPAMLAVDLALSPGESRSYTYTLTLPSTLPPTFRGRMIRFSYELAVGTCRRADSEGVTVSRVMKVPIRVYNWVSLSTPQRPYDLLAPIRKSDAGKIVDLGSAGGDGIVDKKETETSSLASKGSTSTTTSCGSLEDLRAYGNRLLSTAVRVKEPTENAAESSSSSSSLPSGSGTGETTDPLRTFERERERDGEDSELMSCREAVEILTRNSKKVSYDVTKNGLKVAVLTFTKSAYRLGETILGLVEINERDGRGKVVSLSATLETNELLPGSLAPPTSTGKAHTRRVHAEHHASFTGSTLRTTFSLDIPSDACPGFGVVVSNPDAGGVNGKGGLLWKVHLTLLVAVTSPNAQVRGLVRDGAPTSWGTAWRAPPGIAPEEQEPRVGSLQDAATTKQSWASYLMTSFLGTGEKEYHDGDVIDDEDVPSASGEGEGEDEDGDWRKVQVEVVECEVPVVVWPGSTAFSALDVVFDL